MQRLQAWNMPGNLGKRKSSEARVRERLVGGEEPASYIGSLSHCKCFDFSSD